ncbi:hypothetical protein AALO_G00031130, partial [Alosa alosa]
MLASLTGCTHNLKAGKNISALVQCQDSDEDDDDVDNDDGVCVFVCVYVCPHCLFVCLNEFFASLQIYKSTSDGLFLACSHLSLSLSL